jgi:hypothetical protein
MSIRISQIVAGIDQNVSRKAGHIADTENALLERDLQNSTSLPN